MAGRPTLLTDKLRDQMERYLRAGVPVRHATEAVGIHFSRHYAWMARGEEWTIAETDDEIPEEERPYVEYADVMRRATATGRARPAAELARLAYDEETDPAIRTRILIFFLTHGDRENWHPKSANSESTVVEDTKVELEW